MATILYIINIFVNKQTNRVSHSMDHQLGETCMGQLRSAIFYAVPRSPSSYLCSDYR